MADEARHLVVGRLRKPHGLKGDIAIFPLTDDPATVFGTGRALWLMDLEGTVVAGPLTVERSRSYHREWLVKFREADARDTLDAWRGLFVGAPADDLAPPAPDEVYLHELDGFAVRLEDGTPVGLVTGFYELPGGLTLEVQGPKREFLLPFKKEFVLEVHRVERRMVIRPPAGLLDE